MADGGKVAESSRAQYAQATPAGYMAGFGNDFETEALPGALPAGQWCYLRLGESFVAAAPPR